MRNILSSFDQFEEMDSIAARDLQNYQSIYLDLYDKYRRKEDAEKEDITDDIEFEIELIKQVEINIDYILMLVEKYHDGNCEDKEILTSIRKAVDASMQLRSKKSSSKHLSARSMLIRRLLTIGADLFWSRRKQT